MSLLIALGCIIAALVVGCILGGLYRKKVSEREIRIMVKPEEVSEDQMVLLARDIAKKIEDELTYPGQIKVNLLRETKAVDYAK